MSIYPSRETCPPRSHFLQLTPRRQGLSVIDNIVAEYKFFCSRVSEAYRPDDRFEQETVMDAITHAITHVTIGLNPHQNILPDALKHFKEAILISTADLGQQPKAYTVYATIISAMYKWIDLAQLVNPHVVKMPPFAFTHEDIEIAQSGDPGRPADCYDFAFYYLNETKAFPVIFDSKKQQPLGFKIDPVNFLKDWGYEVVNQPIPGDLVVYAGCDPRHQGIMVVKHLGLWTSSRKVLSKTGTFGEVYESPLEDMIIAYGHYVYFFRKTIPSSILKEFVNLTEFLAQKVGNFSHECTRSPLSTLGTLRKIYEYFSKIVIKGVFRRSLYNIAYNLALKEKILQAITSSLPFISSRSKLNALEMLKEMGFKTSHEMRINI